MARIPAVLFVSAASFLWVGAATADPPVRVTSFGRLPLTFERNTGRYDKRVKFLTRTGGATIFFTSTEAVMVLRGKPRAESQEARAGARGKRQEAMGENGVGAYQPPARPITEGPGATRGWFAHPANGGEPTGTMGSSRKSLRDRPVDTPLPPGGDPLAPRHSPLTSVLRMKRVGANAKAVATGLQKQPGIVNYFIGNDPKKWRTRVPTYAKAKLAGVYPGIDVVYYGASGERREASGNAAATPSLATRHSPLAAHLEYDFVVRPGADPKRIRLAFEGADRIRVADGDLILSTPAGDVRMKRPYAYQTIGGKRVRVACDYRLNGQRATLRLARYDASRPLVVDPSMQFSTFVGGSEDDKARAVAVDSAGCAYVAGETYSASFPTSTGGYDRVLAGTFDAFITKLNASGTGMVYSTYLGGGAGDSAYGIAANSAGQAFVMGTASFSGFPTTAGAFQTTGDLSDLFVAKLSASGNSLVYSTYLGGGSTTEWPGGIAIDGAGCAYVTGYTYSSSFPTTAGAYQRVYNDRRDAFATKLNASGSALVYSTYIGRDGNEWGTGIAVDAQGCACIVGSTDTTFYPTTFGAAQTAFGGGLQDAFATKLNAAGSALVFSTYLGGTGDDYGYGVAAAPGGGFIAVGNGASSSFPTTPGAFQRTGTAQAFVCALAGADGSFVYSTLLGGNSSDFARGVAVDSAGNAYVVGLTYSSSFPMSPGAFDTSYAGNDKPDAYMVCLNTTGSGLIYSTYLGGTGEDRGSAIAVDTAGYAYVAGETESAAYPSTAGAFQTSIGGKFDGFITKLKMPAPSAVAVQSASGMVGETIALRATLTRVPDGAALNGKSVAFSVGGSVAGSDTTDASGLAEVSYKVVEGGGSGARAIAAQFGGDGDYQPSSGNSTLTVSKSGAQTTVNSPTGVEGHSVSIAGSLTRTTDGAGVNGRTVRIRVGGSEAGTATTITSGAYTFSYGIPGGASGDLAVEAVFDGDAALLSSSASGTLHVLADTVISVPNVTGQVGATVTLSATLTRELDASPIYGETVSIRVAGALVGSANTGADGVASVAYTIPEGPGGKALAAEFAGNAQYDAATGAGSLTVDQADTTLAVADASGMFGDAVSLAATLARTADGAGLQGRTVIFSVEGTGVGDGATDALGVASVDYLIPEALGAGPKSVTAAFSGDASHNGSDGSGTLTVDRWPTDLAAGDVSGLVSQGVTLSAKLTRSDTASPVVGRLVGFAVEGLNLGTGTTDALGVATLAWVIPDTIGSGAKVIGGAFAGDAVLEPSLGAGTLAVAPANTTLWTNDRSGTITETVALRQYDLKRLTDDAMLEGKTISFKIDGTEVGTATTDAGGDSSLNWAITEGPATRTITAEFAGDAAYTGSSGTATLTCLSWTTKMVSFSRTARITDRTELKARLLRSDNAPLYNKTINFYVDGTFIIARPTNVDGYASYPNYDVPDGAGVGTRTILSEWPGNGGYLAVSKTATLTVLKAIPYIWVLPKSVPQGSIANLYAYFRRLYDYQKQVGKSVDFRLDGTVIQTVVTGSGDQGGVARYLYPTTEAPGVYHIRCEFYGDAWLEPGYGEANLTIY